MKISFITQAIKSFLAGKNYPAKKPTDPLPKKQWVKYNSGKVKKNLNKKPYPINEDKKFRNVTE